ncbi:hypothetical protein AL01_01510 [Bombella intestini]|uniref:Uncharacterized protein n=1 Tax=Bombella intestini TaxID=1539051 RepID=A0A1S8GRM1_9PROT|nr:hypothetical protein AL01_01510 [Bombella intestini]
MKNAVECCGRTLEELSHYVIYGFHLYMMPLTGGGVILPKRKKLWYSHLGVILMMEGLVGTK